MIIWLLSSLAFAGTTTESLQSSWEADGGSGSSCDGSYSSLYAESTATIEFTTPQLVLFKNITVDVWGRHASCSVYLDTVELDLNGSSHWTQFIDQYGNARSVASWHIRNSYTPSDIPKQVLIAGSYDLTISADGLGENNNTKIRTRVYADVEYGTDWDSDGEDSDLLGGTDCDDDNAGINSKATENWYDGIDQNCDGLSDYDQDGDGEDFVDYGGTDCDDEDDEINTAAIEQWYDGIDQNCDGQNDYDQDGDGYLSTKAEGGNDCDDTDPEAYPGSEWWTLDCEYLGVDDESRDFQLNPDTQNQQGCACALSATGPTSILWPCIPLAAILIRRRNRKENEQRATI